MSRHCINPSSETGERGDPPEYESDNFKLCVVCGGEIDLDDDTYRLDEDGDFICEYCTRGDEDDTESPSD